MLTVMLTFGNTAMNNFIKVNYTVFSTTWHINKTLVNLTDIPIMAFDIETKGVYTKAQREEATKLLDADLSAEHHKLVASVASVSGLSFPSLVQTSHFVFGFSRDSSLILITSNAYEEMLVWNWLKNYQGKLLIHNTLFDLKVMYHRVGCFPNNYEDTQLLAKSLINHCDNWKAKVDLKTLMGSFYAPSWTLFDEYEPYDPRDLKFLEYASIDGAATFKLWEDLQIHILGDAWSDKSERDFK